MTNENTLLRAGFRKARFPYIAGAGVAYYRMIREEKRTGAVEIFEQTPVSFPNYRFVCLARFNDDLTSRLMREGQE